MKLDTDLKNVLGVQMFGKLNNKIMNIKEIYCPVCKSSDVADNSTYKSNNVCGPGYHSWKTSDSRVCNVCGVVFKPTKNNQIKDNDLSISIKEEDIDKQAYLVMTNINGLKIKTNISDEHYDTMMKSFCILHDMFKQYFVQKEPNKYQRIIPTVPPEERNR